MFRCTDNAIVADEASPSGRRVLKRGQVYSPDDSAVRAYPSLFVEIVSTAPAVETAAAAPGVKRTATRKKAAAKTAAKPKGDG